MADNNQNDIVREKLSVLSVLPTLDEKLNLASSILTDTLRQNEQLLALANKGAEWQQGAGRNAVFNGNYYETLIGKYSDELADLLGEKVYAVKLENIVKGEVYRRLDEIAYDRFTLDEYADTTKSGRLEIYEKSYPEDNAKKGMLVYLMEQLPNGGVHDYGYIFGYDSDDNHDHAISNYLSLKSFNELRESVFGKPETNVTLNFKETASVGSTVLRTLLYTDGMLNRDKKRTRVEVLPPMGKYSVYAQHFNNVIGDNTTIHIATDSGYLLPLHVDRTNFEKRYFEAYIDRIFEKASTQLNEALTAPDKFIYYDWAAITGRFSEAESHNAPVLKLKNEKQQAQREESLQAEKEKQLKKLEEYDARIDEIAEAIGQSEAISVGYKISEFGGKNPVLDLFKLYEIELPLRTKGWVNTGLAVITKSGYRYYKGKHNGDSTIFGGYLNKLRDAIKETSIDVKRGHKSLPEAHEIETPPKEPPKPFAQQHKECAAAIDEVVRAVRTPGKMAGTATYDLNAALRNLNGKFGSECVSAVLAAVVVKNDADGRYSDDNKKWANTFNSVEIEDVQHSIRYCSVTTHPAILNGLVDSARKYSAVEREKKPDMLAKINSNKQKVERDKAANADTPNKHKKKATEV